MKRRLIATMIALTMGVGVTTMSGCTEKSEEEKTNENEIRKLLQYDANINISKDIVENRGFKLNKEIEDSKYMLTFKTSIYKSAGRTAVLVDYDEITYSVDKDFYYDFCENYSTTETKKEVDMVTELTFNYDPIKVIEAGQEIEIGVSSEK